jgi:hypothetical protein
MHLYEEPDFEMLASCFRSMQESVQGFATTEELGKLKAFPSPSRTLVFDTSAHSFNEQMLNCDRVLVRVFLNSLRSLPCHFESLKDSVWIDTFASFSVIQASVHKRLEDYRSSKYPSLGQGSEEQTPPPQMGWEDYRRMDLGLIEASPQNVQDALLTALHESKSMVKFVERGHKHVNNEVIQQPGTSPKVEMLSSLIQSLMRIQTIYKWLVNVG